MTNKELMSMMVWLDPFSRHAPGNGYEYTHVVGTDELVEGYENNDWSIVADYKGTPYGAGCGPARDVIMWRKLVVYPHDRVIGPGRRALEL